MTEKYTLTKEHEAQLPAWRDKWIDIAMRTTPQTVEDKEKCSAAIVGLYVAANLPVVPVYYVPSPFVGSVAWSVASVWLWLQENPTQFKSLFGVDELSQGDISASAILAIKKVSPAASVEAAIQKAVSQSLNMPGAFTSEKPVASSEVLEQVKTMFLKAMAKWSSGWNGGNHWAGFCAHISFFREIVKLDLPEYSKWIHYENAAIYGSHRFMHKSFCLVSDFPLVIKKDKSNRSHSAEGPALCWSDGFEINSWHGEHIPTDALKKLMDEQVESCL